MYATLSGAHSLFSLMMPKTTRTEEAFHALLEGAEREASAQVRGLVRLATALKPTALPEPDPRFRARLRNELLAHASASEEELFAAMLEGDLTTAVEELKPLVAVASSLAPARLPEPDVAFRYRLRNSLVAHGARNQSLAARVVDRVSEVNTKLRSSLRVVAATGMAAMMMLGGSAALAASSGALPGDALYAVKQWKESAQLVVVDGDEEGVRLLSFAGERLDEIEGLDERGVSDQRLYTGTLEEMDALTNQAAEIIIGGFRTRGGKEPNAMLDLAGFAKTQRLHLTRLMDRLPPAVRPAVLDSIAVAEAVQERTETVLENPACPCDANPLAPSTDESASDEPVSCECEPAAAAPTEPQPASRPEDDSDPEPDPDDDRDDDSGGKDDDEDEDTDVDVPDVDGTDADDEAEEVINDLIDDLGLPIPEPSSAPVDPTALLP